MRGGGRGGRLALGLDVTLDTSVAKCLELNNLENNTYVRRSYLKKGVKVEFFVLLLILNKVKYPVRP